MSHSNAGNLLDRGRMRAAIALHTIRWHAARFRRDLRGGTAVQAMAMMPVMLAGLYLGMLLWQTIQVRRSLHTGTYLATRYLSLYAPDNLHQDTWGGVARQFVFAELKGNPWVDSRRLFAGQGGGGGDGRVEVVFLDGCFDCACKFRIDSYFKMRNIIPGASGTWALPDLDAIELKEERVGEVLCR